MNPSGGTAPQKRPDPGFTGVRKPQTAVSSRGSGVGMTSFRSNRKFSRVALAATIGMAVMIGCAGSFAQAADDDDDELLDIKIFRGILKGLGLRKDEPTGIEYRERSPLVLPPSKELPPPEADAAAKKAASWPDDPDIKRVKTAQGGGAQTQGLRRRAWTTNRCCPASCGNARPRQRRQGRRSAGQIGGSRGRAQHQCRIGLQGPHGPCSARFGRRRKNTSPFTGEPPRSSLIEPPPGYRTPSPTQPYGVGREKWIAPVIDKNEPVK